MNIEEARKIVEVHKHLDKVIHDDRFNSLLEIAVRFYISAKGFIEGYESGRRDQLEENTRRDIEFFKKQEGKS